MTLKLICNLMVRSFLWWALTGCTSQKPILVGFAGELTGRRSELGVAARDGAQLAMVQYSRQYQPETLHNNNSLQIIKHWS